MDKIVSVRVPDLRGFWFFYNGAWYGPYEKRETASELAWKVAPEDQKRIPIVQVITKTSISFRHGFNFIKE